jgi:uncharacterized protein (TIGR03435 family)
MRSILVRGVVGIFTMWWACAAGFGQTLAFDVASVRENKSGAPPAGDETSSNVPLGPGDVFAATGGSLTVRNYPLMQYIAFAYRMTDGQLKTFREKAPEWVLNDRFNLQARTENSAVTKDQMRLMVRSLLAERFKMAVHYETRQEPVYGLLLVKPGATGPKLREHPAAVPCSADFSAREDGREPDEAVAEGFPTVCGGTVGMTASAADRYKLGSRNVRMGLIASTMASWGNLGRAVVDETGLEGRYDFVLEFTPESLAGGPQDSGGQTFLEAVKKQLGLRFEAQSRPVQVLVLDHMEHLTEN